MRDYFVFGGCLRSDLEFPELTEARGSVSADWTLAVGPVTRREPGEILSDVEFTPTCRVTLSRGPGWLRYSHSCAGTFEIATGGKRIVFEASIDGDLAIARTDFIARVLLHCVDRARVTWLHGSAVRIGSRAVAFLGQSGAGKSTLALALARAGCEHICDDTLPVEAGAPSVVWPSDHIIRLCADTKGHLASRAQGTHRESDGKFIMTGRTFDSEKVRQTSTSGDTGRWPLAAVYFLRPSALALGSDAARRRPLGPTLAIPGLMQHLKLDPVTGPADPARLVGQLGTIASSTPAFELTVARDWTRIDDVVRQLVTWHGEPASATAMSRSPIAVPA